MSLPEYERRLERQFPDPRAYKDVQFEVRSIRARRYSGWLKQLSLILQRKPTGETTFELAFYGGGVGEPPFGRDEFDSYCRDAGVDAHYTKKARPDAAHEKYELVDVTVCSLDYETVRSFIVGIAMLPAGDYEEFAFRPEDEENAAASA